MMITAKKRKGVEKQNMNVKWKPAVLTCNLTLNYSETTKFSANTCEYFHQWNCALVDRTFLLAREDMLTGNINVNVQKLVAFGNTARM